MIADIKVKYLDYEWITWSVCHCMIDNNNMYEFVAIAVEVSVSFILELYFRHSLTNGASSYFNEPLLMCLNH